MKNAILRYETRCALFHHDFSTQKLSAKLRDELFGADLEQTVAVLSREGFKLPQGTQVRKIKNPPVLNAYSAPLKLFLDVSNFCNLACAHCLSSSSSSQRDQLAFKTIEDIADQCEEIGTFYVKISGGEPLLYHGILALIDMLNAHSLDVSLTTNGTMMRPQLAGELLSRDVKVSVSIDGTQPTHDAIRGKGSYDSAVRALEILKEAGANASIRTTLFPSNIQDVYSLVELAEKYDVILKIRRAKPSGRATYNGMIMTRPTPEYYELISYLNDSGSRVDIEDIMNTNPEYRKDLIVSNSDCGAGTRSIHVSQHGNVSPCIFLGPAFTAGNVFKGDRLIDVWRKNQQFQMARVLASAPSCHGCKRESICHNECPAIKLYATGSFNGLDPSCLKPYLEKPTEQTSVMATSAVSQG